MSIAVPIGIEHLFATSVLMDEPPSTAIDAAAVSQFARETAGDEGDFSSDRATSPALQPLIDHTLMLANRLTANVLGVTPASAWEVRCSIRIAAEGSVPVTAPAFDAYWRTLYVADGGGGESEVTLRDPRLPAPMMERPDLRLRYTMQEPPVVYEPEVQVSLRSGQLLMVPGWLGITHHPSTGPRPRVLVSLALIARLESA